MKDFNLKGTVTGRTSYRAPEPHQVNKRTDYVCTRNMLVNSDFSRLEQHVIATMGRGASKGTATLARFAMHAQKLLSGFAYIEYYESNALTKFVIFCWCRDLDFETYKTLCRIHKKGMVNRKRYNRICSELTNEMEGNIYA